MLNPSVQFSCSVVSDSFWPHGLQYGRPPCPSPTPGAYSNSCPSSWWCHPTISPSVVPFSSCLQSFPVSGSFPTNQYLNHYCLLTTLRASPACQPGHLHSTQASSFAAPWGGPFEGIPHPRLEAEHGCVLVLSHNTGERHLKNLHFLRRACHILHRWSLLVLVFLLHWMSGPQYRSQKCEYSF